MKPTISVAVVTKNRPANFERAIRSLRAQSEQPWEIVISDDSDATCRTANERIARGFDCRYVAGPRRGLYANRNAAALACRGSHIRTMDDDHTFPEEHFAACTRAVEDHPDAVWNIGECIPSADGTGTQYYCPGQLHPRGFSVTPPAGRRMWAIADGAAIYPRRIFDEGSRFYEGFVFGAAYLEWGSRLHWLGYDIRHLSSTYVVHHAEGRSYDDEFTDAASRLFAGLSHSFLYQPTVRNQLLTFAEVGIVCVRLRSTGVRAAVAAGSAFREHRRGITARQTARARTDAVQDNADG